MFLLCMENGRGDFVRSVSGTHLKVRTTGLEPTRLYKQTEGPWEHTEFHLKYFSQK
jgi:hypothetical protein